jgi:putative membrane protein insertion efficiency factor
LKLITETSSNVVSGGANSSSRTVRDAGLSPGVRAALVLLRGYKLFFSPYFKGSCRFLPSCADYAAEAVTRHGLVRGSWLAARRLARCHPLCAGGHDPVPLQQ